MNKDICLLPLNVSKSLELKLNKGLAYHEIMKIALCDNTDDIGKWLSLDMENNFSKLVKSFYNGYEIDEFEKYKNIGLLDSSFFIKDYIRYMPTFIIFEYSENDFNGSIWLPYYSKPDYKAAMSFYYKGEKIPNGSRLEEDLCNAPEWFQKLYLDAKKYITERNKSILLDIETIFNDLYSKLNEKYLIDELCNNESDLNESECEIIQSIINYRYAVIPVLLKKLKTTKDSTDEIFFCKLIDCIHDFEWVLESHGEEDSLEEYNQIKKDLKKWKVYLLNWGEQADLII